MLTEYARNLRHNATAAEHKLWFFLKNRRFENLKFRRQYPVCRYIADFVCLEANLIIEIDGSQHMDQAHYDNQRTKKLEQQGFTVIRFWNNEVLNDTETVLDKIHQTIQDSRVIKA